MKPNIEVWTFNDADGNPTGTCGLRGVDSKGVRFSVRFHNPCELLTALAGLATRTCDLVSQAGPAVAINQELRG